MGQKPLFANKPDLSLTDTELIEGFLAGRKAEHNEIVGWISGLVKTRLWDRHVTPEDVVAESTMKLLVNLRAHEFRLESSLKTYVQRLTLYTLVDACRRTKDAVSFDDERFIADGPTPHVLMEEQEDEKMLVRAMAMIPDGCKELFDMTLRQRLKCKEIAVKLETSEGAVKTRLSRCRDKLEESFRRLS